MTIFPKDFVAELRAGGISARLVLTYFIAILSLSLILGTISFWLMSRSLEMEQESQLQVQNHVLESVLNGFLESQVSNLERLATDDAIKKFVQSFNELVLIQHLQKFENFEDFHLTNPSGLTEIGFKEGELESGIEDLSKTRLFLQAEALPNTVHLVDSSYTSRIKNGIYLGYYLVSYFGEKQGFIEVRSSNKALKQRIESFSMPSKYHRIISDQRGFVIYASSSQWDDQILQPDERRRINEHQNQVIQTSLLDCEDCYVQSIQVGQTPWIATTFIPAEEFEKAVREFRLINAVLFALVSLLLLIWVFRATKHIVWPIKELTDTTREISRTEDMNKRVNWSSKDELGELATAFNQMLDKLQGANQEIIQARNEIEEIISSIADPIIVADANGRIVRHNKAAMTLLGYSDQEFSQMEAGGCLAPDQEIIKASIFNDVIQHGSMSGIETVLQSKRGERIHVSLSAAMITNAHGKMTGTVFAAKDISSLKQAETHLQYLASHDSLTGLPNRMLLLDRLDQVLKRISRYKTQSALFFFDLDRFKLVNDTLGHDAGDQLLQKIASRLKASVRDSDTVARLGGDEFVVLANDLNSLDDIKLLAEKMIEKLRAPIELKGHSYIATTSIGVSVLPQHGMNAEMLMKKADMAMYEAKHHGRNTYRIYSEEMSDRIDTSFHMENAIRQAIDEDRFENFYQLIVDAKTRRITGIEALVRWRTVEGEIKTPDHFLSIAEEAGLILQIGQGVLERACRQTRLWHDMGFKDLTVAVNVADRQFRDDEFTQNVATALSESGLNSNALNLELTEGILMHNSDIAIDTVGELKRLGLHLSVDDFGTGYSSLSHLQRISLDTVKIDRSFVMELPENNGDAMICEAIIELAHKLNLNIVAEGIETEEQAVFLRQMGADKLQGYYFSKPLPAQGIEQLLLAGRDR